MRIVKHRAGRNRELILAVVAHKLVTFDNSADLVGMATQASNAFGKSQGFEIETALGIRAELLEQFDKIDVLSLSYFLFHIFMSKPKKNVKPLDMTSDEAVDFLFPKDAIEEMKKVANPEKQRASTDDDNSNGDSHIQPSR